MKSRFLETHELYDGSQLVSLNNYLKHGLLGDSVVAWVGPCDVSVEHMVDGEDLLAGALIRGESMVHWIIELFDATLFAAVGVQRLFAAIVKDILAESSPEKGLVARLRRDGDDIYCDDLKLSISIATQSPSSSLIHLAVNAANRGTPVATISLAEFKVEPKIFAQEAMRRLSLEIASVRDATRKVRSVR